MKAGTNTRLAQLRDANDIIQDLEQRLDGQDQNEIQFIRADLKSAGAKIGTAGFTRFLEKAMGRAAGIAIASNFTDIADRATRVLDGSLVPDDSDDDIRRTTDDKGRVTLGAQYANLEVTVRVLETRRVEAE